MRADPVEPCEVVVLICCYNGRAYLDDCLGSVTASQDPGLVTRVVLVDNASTDGSGDYVRAHFPLAQVVRIDPNGGFTGGNNAGWHYAQEHYPQAGYLVLLNVDTFVESGWLRALVDTVEQNDPTGQRIGAAQAKLLLHDNGNASATGKRVAGGPVTGNGRTPRRINTAGNRSHYLGFGFMTAYDEPDDGRFDQPGPIDFASGAVVLVRTDLLRRVGLFDPTLYMYHEDTELGWKLRQIGYDTWFAPASVVHHKYKPDAPLKYYYYLERNRWLLLLTYYRLRTLALLAPALMLMEFGQSLFALWQGRLWDKLRSGVYLLVPSHVAMIRRRRREAQQRRCIGDRAFMGKFAGTIRFRAIENPLLRWVGNPLLCAYWAVARRLIWW